MNRLNRQHLRSRRAYTVICSRQFLHLPQGLDPKHSTLNTMRFAPGTRASQFESAQDLPHPRELPQCFNHLVALCKNDRILVGDGREGSARMCEVCESDNQYLQAVPGLGI